jgi:hypothetical protein
MNNYAGFFSERAAPPGPPVAPLVSPPQAADGDLPPALLTDTFKGYQSTRGYVTQGDTAADLISFAGFPDRIEITVLTFAAILNFTDEQNREGPDIRIEANGTYDAQLRAKKVRARNATAGSNATVQAIGKWICGSESPYALRLNR